MRTVFAVALCFVVGACATFGGGEPDISGIYDLVSVNGEALPTPDVTKAWLELRADGVSVFTSDQPSLTDLEVDTGKITLEEMEDGCIPVYIEDDTDPIGFDGSVCGEVLTVEIGNFLLVFHKRR